MLSFTIERQRKAYYDQLETYQRTLDVTEWLVWFSQTVLTAQQTTLDRVAFTSPRHISTTGTGSVQSSSGESHCASVRGGTGWLYRWPQRGQLSRHHPHVARHRHPRFAGPGRQRGVDTQRPASIHSIRPELGKRNKLSNAFLFLIQSQDHQYPHQAPLMPSKSQERRSRFQCSDKASCQFWPP